MRERARDRIGEALLDLCSEHGYRSLSLQMLLDRAEVEEDAFRLHFDDLEDCFCKIYEELRENSQLLVITHQKRTMEVGDALYGVTMRGDGVSAVISQRLRETAAS